MSVPLEVGVESTEAPSDLARRLHELADALVVPPRDGGDRLRVVAPLVVHVHEHGVQHGPTRIVVGEGDDVVDEAEEQAREGAQTLDALVLGDGLRQVTPFTDLDEHAVPEELRGQGSDRLVVVPVLPRQARFGLFQDNHRQHLLEHRDEPCREPRAMLLARDALKA